MNPDSNWQQPPAIKEGLPVSLQLLSTGAGVGVGCGVGIGFISPVNLSAIPVLGQAAQGVSTGLAGVSTWLAGASSSARHAARSLGVPGLDVGAGCGVLAGYYFGAGLMVKPSVVDQVTRSTTQLAGHVVQALRKALPVSSTPATVDSSDHPAVLTVQHTDRQQQQQQGHGLANATSTRQPSQEALGPYAPQHSIDGMISGDGSGTPAKPGRPGSNMQEADPAMTRLLLQHQVVIERLKRQNKQLREAVCELRPSADMCRRRRAHTTSKQLRHSRKDRGSSESTWNDSP